MKKENVIKSLKNGSFIGKFINKLDFLCLNLITGNKNATIFVKQCKAYSKLKNKYKNIINNYSTNESGLKSNKIWVCWFQGIENAPDIVKACYNSVKSNLTDYEVILLDDSNIDKYIELPQYIVDKYKNGNIAAANYSDLIRISLLTKWGGTWIDATTLCTSPELMKKIDDVPLFVFKDLDLTHADKKPIVASSWFIHSYSNNRVISLTRDLLFQYWKDYNYAIDYFIFHICFTLATEKFSDEWKNVPVYNNLSPHTMMFELNDTFMEQSWSRILEQSDFHKLTHHLSFDNQNSIYYHVLKKYQ